MNINLNKVLLLLGIVCLATDLVALFMIPEMPQGETTVENWQSTPHVLWSFVLLTSAFVAAIGLAVGGIISILKAEIRKNALALGILAIAFVIPMFWN